MSYVKLLLQASVAGIPLLNAGISIRCNESSRVSWESLVATIHQEQPRVDDGWGRMATIAAGNTSLYRAHYQTHIAPAYKTMLTSAYTYSRQLVQVAGGAVDAPLHCTFTQQHAPCHITWQSIDPTIYIAWPQRRQGGHMFFPGPDALVAQRLTFTLTHELGHLFHQYRKIPPSFNPTTREGRQWLLSSLGGLGALYLWGQILNKNEQALWRTVGLIAYGLQRHIAGLRVNERMADAFALQILSPELQPGYCISFVEDLCEEALCETYAWSKGTTEIGKYYLACLQRSMNPLCYTHPSPQQRLIHGGVQLLGSLTGAQRIARCAQIEATAQQAQDNWFSQHANQHNWIPSGGFIIPEVVRKQASEKVSRQLQQVWKQLRQLP